MSIETPFDVLFNNFFGNTGFTSLALGRIGYPADVYETKNSLNIEIAAVGLDKKDVTVEVKGDTLHVFYTKKSEQEGVKNYLYRGITKKAFDLGWKIAPRYNLEKIEVTLDKGMLTITIPAIEEEELVKSIEIK